MSLFLMRAHDLRDFQVHDAQQVRLGQRVEDDQVVQTVEELRLEDALGFLQDFALHRLVILLVLRHAEPERHLPLDEFRADVGGHDDDRVAEVDLAAQRIRDLAFFQNLEQQVHHVRVRLFDFVEQHDRVRPAAHRFGELAAFLVTDVAGRRADQARRRELLHVLAHVDLDERVAVAEHELRQRAGQERLAHARRAQEDERANRTLRVFQVRAAAAQRLADGDDRFVLADDLLRAVRFPWPAASRFPSAPCAGAGRR